MKFEHRIITPQFAEDLLKNNSSNRPVSIPTVTHYARQMENGQWKENTAEAIKVSVTGKLLDGQHRLHAVVKYGRGVSFLYVSELEDDIFTVLDTGKKRNGADILSIAQVKNAAFKASGIASWFAIVKNHQLRDDTGVSLKHLGITNQTILDEYNNRPAFWDNIANETIKNYRGFAKTISPSYLFAWTARLHEIHPALATEFMNKLCFGFELKPYDAIYHLRTALMTSKNSLIKKLDNKYKNALLIKAWNFFVRNQDVKHLNYNPTTETFPKLDAFAMHVEGGAKYNAPQDSKNEYA